MSGWIFIGAGFYLSVAFGFAMGLSGIANTTPSVATSAQRGWAIGMLSALWPVTAVVIVVARAFR